MQGHIGMDWNAIGIACPVEVSLIIFKKKSRHHSLWKFTCIKEFSFSLHSVKEKIAFSQVGAGRVPLSRESGICKEVQSIPRTAKCWRSLHLLTKLSFSKKAFLKSNKPELVGYNWCSGNLLVELHYHSKKHREKAIWRCYRSTRNKVNS